MAAADVGTAYFGADTGPGAVVIFMIVLIGFRNKE